MAALEPFRAILFNPSIDAALVTSPPYDVISVAEQQRLRDLHPYNIIQIILGAELPGDEPGRDKYSRAASHLRDWIREGVLVADDRPRLYAYRMEYSLAGAPRETGGIIGALELEPLDGGSIHPHEHTMPKPRSDRLDLMRAAEANPEPIWLVGGPGLIGPAVAEASGAAAMIDFTDPAGVRHRLWPLDDAAAAPFAGGLHLPLVIADGHHRYAASLLYRDEMRAAHGRGPWDATLALVSDPSAAPPSLLPIHRLTDLSLDEVRSHLGGEWAPFAGDLASLAGHLAEAGPGTIGVAHAAGRWTVPSHGAPDTAWLASGILEPLSRSRPETPNVSVTYEHDLDAVAEGVEAGAVAFLVAPIPIQDVIEAALAGRVMPTKSTLFWPKPRTGMLLRDMQSP